MTLIWTQESVIMCHKRNSVKQVKSSMGDRHDKVRA